jgi:hypothetical protein
LNDQTDLSHEAHSELGQPAWEAPWWVTSPGWPTQSAAILAFLWTCWYAILPAMPLKAVLVLLLWLVLAAVLVLRLFLRYTALEKHKNPTSGIDRVRWSLIPALCFLALTLMFSGLGCRIGFALSRPSLERLLQKAMASPQPLQPKGFVGLYRIQSVGCSSTTDPRQCVIDLLDADEGHGGFRYESKPVHHVPSTEEMDLGDGWYSWRHWPT